MMARRSSDLLVSSLCVHLVQLALAAAPGVAAAWFFASKTGELGLDIAPSASLLEVARTLSGTRASRPPIVDLGGIVFLIAAGLSIVAHAPIQQSWLRSLKGESGRESIRSGFRRAPAALIVSLLITGAFLLAGAAACSLPLTGHFAMQHAANARTHDLVVAALSVPVIALVWAWACAHDLARAALVDEVVHPVEAAMLGVRALIGPAPLAYGAFAVTQLALVACALWLTTRGGAALPAITCALASHLLLYGRTVVRALWLSRCMNAVHAQRAAAAVDTLEAPSP